MRTFHFNLASLKDVDGLMIHANFQDYPLQAHTELTRQNAKKNNLLFQHLGADQLTHFVTDVPTPPSRPSLMQISKPLVINGQTINHVVGMKICLPPEGRALALKMIRENAGPGNQQPHPKLTRLAAKSSSLLQAMPGLTGLDGLDDHVDYFDMAVALLFQHPSLINLNETAYAKVPAYIIENAITDAIGRDYGLPLALEDLGDGWSTEEPVYEEFADGNKEHMQDPDNPGTYLYAPKLHQDVLREIEGALKQALLTVQQDIELKGQQWTVEYGTGADTKSGMELTAGQPLRAALSKWVLSNKTPGNGLAVSPKLNIEPAETIKGTYEGSGVWFDDPKRERKEPLTREMAKLLLDEKVYLKINTQGTAEVAFVPIKLERQDGDGPYTGSINQPLRQGTLKASFSLNTYKSGLEYTVTCTGLDVNSSAELAVLEGDTRRIIKLLDWTSTDGSPWVNYINVDLTNTWLRHLGIYIQYIDVAGNPIPLDETWVGQLPQFLTGVFEPSPSKKFLNVLGPVNTVFGIPVLDETINVRFPVHKDAHTIRLFAGGLGTGEFDKAVCLPGIILTVAIELALPIFMITAGAALKNSKLVTRLMADKRVRFGLIALGLTLTGLDTLRTGDSKKPLLRLANAAGPLLLKTGLEKMIVDEVAAATAAKLIPLVGTALQVMNTCISLAQIGQTIAAVVQAPFVYNCDIVASVDIVATLVPDTTLKYYPPQAVSYKVQIVYDKSATTLVYNGVLGTITEDPIPVHFNDAPSGGNVKVYVFFYAANGWQAGQGESPWYAARGNTGGTTLKIDSIEVVNNAVPLTKKSVYSHLKKIAFDDNGLHIWQKTDNAPATTRLTPPPDRDHDLRTLSSISLAQRPAALGYTWQATGLNIPRDTDPEGPPVNDSLYITQNISILQRPDTGYAATKVGFNYDPGVGYDIGTKDNGTGHNFIITLGKDENYHLRKIKLSFDAAKQETIPPIFDPRDKESWGKFPVTLYRYVIHPQGYVFGISTNTSKIYSIKIPESSTTEELAIFASLASGPGRRDGLIKGPAAIAIGIDGIVLVLEAANKRVQAFDINCNPVANYFSNNGVKSCFLDLPDKPDTLYLDLAVEAKGYLYVLAEENGGHHANDYVVTIYTPDGEQLVATRGVAAAKLALGLDRSMYTLNYELIFGKNKRTEPSVSFWIPPAPDVQF